MSASIKVEGLREVGKQLEGLSNALQRRIINKAARAAMKPLVATARKGVPRKTGNLRRSIGIKRLKRTGKGEHVYLLGARPGYEYTDENGKKQNPYYYSIPVEFGHILKIKGKPTGVFIAPVAFLRNAYHQHRLKVVQDFAARVKQGIEDQLRAKK